MPKHRQKRIFIPLLAPQPTMEPYRMLGWYRVATAISTGLRLKAVTQTVTYSEEPVMARGSASVPAAATRIFTPLPARRAMEPILVPASYRAGTGISTGRRSTAEQGAALVLYFALIQTAATRISTHLVVNPMMESFPTRGWCKAPTAIF